MTKQLDKKTIAIVGLGLIGGSLAKTIKLYTDYTVYGIDSDKNIVKKAMQDMAIDDSITKSNLAICDLVIVCLYPSATIEYVKNNIVSFKKGAVVVDCSGVKEKICKQLSPLCADNNIYFVGGHPMAGIEKSGYDHSFAHMFDNATMVLCKDDYTAITALDYLSDFFKELCFGKITYALASEHDRAIAFTSQMAHVVSNAYVQSSQADIQTSFSGGSYKDLTRVAKLNPTMWTELFIDNKDALSKELSELIERLTNYKTAIETADSETLFELLKKGSQTKETVG